MENPEITPEALAALSQSVSLSPSRPEVNEQGRTRGQAAPFGERT